jgi:hypothetical protein
VANVAGRGYRFVAPVAVTDQEPSASPHPARAQSADKQCKPSDLPVPP